MAETKKGKQGLLKKSMLSFSIQKKLHKKLTKAKPRIIRDRTVLKFVVVLTKIDYVKRRHQVWPCWQDFFWDRRAKYMLLQWPRQLQVEAEGDESYLQWKTVSSLTNLSSKTMERHPNPDSAALPEQGWDRRLQVVTSGSRRFHPKQRCPLVYSAVTGRAQPTSVARQSPFENRSSSLSCTMNISLHYENIMPTVSNKILTCSFLTYLRFLVVSRIYALQYCQEIPAIML